MDALLALLPPKEQLSALLSKVLGYGILAGSCITKVPQISAVLKSGSAEGLSPLSFELETAGLLVHSSYGFLTRMPFNAYGEALILFAQSLLLLLMIYRFAKISAVRASLATGLLAAWAAAVLAGQVSQEQVQMAFNANNLVFMAARCPQIYSNWRTKSTGQLSLATSAINLVGCVVRIFTSVTERAGTAMVRSYCISLALNLILVTQIFLYAPTPKARPARKGEAKKNR